jgi:SAM-dependent methyltransferase
MKGRIPKEESKIPQLVRESYLRKPRLNQYWFFKNSFEWLLPYMKQEDNILELGCAHGLSREFLKFPNLVLSDIEKNPWTDMVIDAQNITLPDNSVDVVFSNNILHHLEYPCKALTEIERILKPGGYYLIQDVRASLLLRLLLWITKIEDINDKSDPFDLSTSACGNKPWEGNNAIPDLMFLKNPHRLKEVCPKLNMIECYPTSCILLMNSGGTTSNFPFIPLTRSLLKFVETLDSILCKFVPGIFALQTRVVFQKVA